MDKSRIAVGAVLLLVLVVVVIGAKSLWTRSHRTDLERALSMVPAATQRLGFTDWSAVRRATRVPDTTSSKTLETLSNRAYDEDFSAASSIKESAVALQEKLGFSVGQAEWEAYAQSDEGAVMVLRMPDGFDFDKVRAKLADGGYTKPKDDDGVWNGGIDVTAALDPTITPELQYVAVLSDQHVIVSSDTPAYARTSARVARGDGRSLADVDSAAGVADGLDGSVSAMVWARDFACEDLSMATAAEDDQQRAEDLVARAGKVSPLDGLAMSMGADRRLTVVERFADDAQARANLRARAALAVGEAVGRGGSSFSEDYRLTSSRTHGNRVLLVLRPRAGVSFVLSALDNGPVLFATC